MHGGASAFVGLSQIGLVALQHFEVLQREAGAADHGRLRAFRHNRRDPGVYGHIPVEAAQLRASAREDDAPVEDVSGQLGWRLLQDRADRADDEAERLLDRLDNLVRRNFEAARQPGQQVAAAYIADEWLFHRHGGAGGDLDLLRGALADEKVVLAPEVGGDGVVDAVASDTDRVRDDHAGQRDDGDLGRAAADLADRVGARLVDGQARADGGSDGLVDQPGLARAGRDRGLRHRAALDRRDTGRDADHDLGLEDPLPALDLADEVMQHALGHHE